LILFGFEGGGGLPPDDHQAMLRGEDVAGVM